MIHRELIIKETTIHRQLWFLAQSLLFTPMDTPFELQNSASSIPVKQPILHPDSLISFKNRYFLADSVTHGYGITLVDEDTIVYGDDSRVLKSDCFIVASKSKKRIIAALNVHIDGSLSPVACDQDDRRIVDLNDAGERWEGCTMNGMPFGWGKRFNENGDLMYEGFSIFDRYCLYGTDYYPDLHTVRYEGNWCDGKRCGKGVLFNRRGEKVFEGEWMSDSQVIDPTVGVENTPILPVLTSLIEILIIGENCCNECDSLLLNDYPRLKGVHIGSGSFGKESEEEMLFSCVNCPELIILELSVCVMQHYERMLVQGEEWASE